MDTEYCDKCGLLHDPEDGECLGCELQADNNRLREMLISVAKTTHKSKELYEWYCKETSKPEIKELTEGK